jgi:hypothetical protein
MQHASSSSWWEEVMDLALLKERAKAKQIYREYEAIQTLLNNVTVSIKAKMKASYDAIDRYGKSELRRKIHELERELQDLRTEFGVKATMDELVKVLQSAEAQPGLALHIIKAALVQLIGNYEKKVPGFSIFPEHTYIQIDNGQFREEEGDFDWILQEASLYEDMCSLFNLAKERNSNLNRKRDSRNVIKTASSLARTSIVAAYNFLEAYLKGIAIDHVLLNGESLYQKTTAFLLEWDQSTKCQKFVSLRDKLLQYPKLIKNLEHPPLQETSCTEMDFVLGRGKRLRDSIVHASPLASTESKNEPIAPLFKLDFGDVEFVVDNVVRLVRKIEQVIHANDHAVVWMKDREPNGLFPDSAFH